MNLLLKMVSSPWFWADIFLSVVGGLIVYWGLKVEKKAEKRLPPSDFDRDIFEDVVRAQKKEEQRGWRILMTGIVVEVVAALGISVISGLEIADLSDQTAVANREAKDAEKQAGEANLRASTNELAALALQREVLRLKNPAIITDDQRQKFIDILSDWHNYSKTRIEVVDGNIDKPTEQFAFQIRALLDEAGYGSNTSKYQLPIIPIATNGICISFRPPDVKLPAFEWRGAVVRKIPDTEVTPLPVSTNPIIFKITNAATGFSFASENPFTDEEPNIIAIFSGKVPTPNFRPTNAPSVFVAYPGVNVPMRNASYMYVPTKDPNAILYGLCEVFHDIGITVGETTNDDILEPGHVGFFIPNR
jgi:hypothetical protein